MAKEVIMRSAVGKDGKAVFCSTNAEAMNKFLKANPGLKAGKDIVVLDDVVGSIVSGLSPLEKAALAAYGVNVAPTAVEIAAAAEPAVRANKPPAPKVAPKHDNAADAD